MVPAARAGASAGMMRHNAASSAHAQAQQHMASLLPAQQQSRTGLAPCTPSRLQTQRVAALVADRGAAQAESSSDTQRKLKVLIAGAGIGGLVLAVALIKKGVDVAVFERDLTAIRGEGKYRGPIQVGCCFGSPLLTSLLAIGLPAGGCFVWVAPHSLTAATAAAEAPAPADVAGFVLAPSHASSSTATTSTQTRRNTPWDFCSCALVLSCCCAVQVQSNALAALEAIDPAVADAVLREGCITGDRINGLCDGETGDW